MNEYVYVVCRLCACTGSRQTESLHSCRNTEKCLNATKQLASMITRARQKDGQRWRGMGREASTQKRCREGWAKKKVLRIRSHLC